MSRDFYRKSIAQHKKAIMRYLEMNSQLCAIEELGALDNAIATAYFEGAITMTETRLLYGAAGKLKKIVREEFWGHYTIR